MSKKELISNETIECAFNGTNFSDSDRRKLVGQSILKLLTGYSCGHTMFTILVELKLITSKGTVTKLGKKFCCDVFYCQGGVDLIKKGDYIEVSGIFGSDPFGWTTFTFDEKNKKIEGTRTNILIPKQEV